VAMLTAGFGPFTVLATGPKHAASGISRSPALNWEPILDKSEIKPEIT